MLLVCVTPPIKAGSADAKVPASFAGIADLLRVLKHLKFALNVAFFVRHRYFLHPKSGNLSKVSQETVHIYSIPRSTFYRWYDLYVDGGLDALADHSPRPGSVWNRIPDARRNELIEFALEHEALSTRELAVKYTDEKRYFISESSAYRILKAADLITAPDYVVIKAADEFKDKTTAINEMWQTAFTYFKIIGCPYYRSASAVALPNPCRGWRRTGFVVAGTEC